MPLQLSEVDPFRQPLNPLGSRSEIHRTISWIKTHLEEDPDVSLPKQEVYEEYGYEYNYSTDLFINDNLFLVNSVCVLK